METKYKVTLTVDERKTLLKLISEGKTNKEKLIRARILLKANCGEEGEHWEDGKIAEAFYVHESTVKRARKSFVEEGFDAALERKPPSKSRQRIIQGEEEAHLIALTCGDPPEGHSRWTLRLLSNAMIKLEYVDAVSHETIRTVLKKTNLSLGKKKSGTYPPKANAEFVCQMPLCNNRIERPQFNSCIRSGELPVRHNSFFISCCIPRFYLCGHRCSFTYSSI